MAITKPEINIYWFRRDLRLDDNTALHYALKSGKPVLPIFIFDTEILNKLESKFDARVEFIYNSIEKLDTELKQYNSGILTLYGNPLEVWNKLIKKFNIISVFFNRDYEPYAVKRDREIEHLLTEKGIRFFSFKDQVIFEKDEIIKQDGSPYTVYTPYKNKWLENFSPNTVNYNISNYKNNFYKYNNKILTLSEIGFKKSNIQFPDSNISKKIIENYHLTRNFPYINGTSKLSVHLRFGTISIRKLAKIAFEINLSFLNELIWREFFMMILYHFPHSSEKCFKPQYELINWNNSEDDFKKWCSGNTGYPIVDAGMRELNKTGYMHNRVRMITASFLCKHLLIDWRWGEKYFAVKLLDYEMSSNVGNWQWAAGTGCDAAPYFRIFNPILQQKKFDPNFVYIKKWVTEYNSANYPAPIIEHKFARNRTLAAYKKAINHYV